MDMFEHKLEEQKDTNDYGVSINGSEVHCSGIL
ncbi:hypothetical protein ES703_111234 [subsurface metagenome]